MNQLPLEQRCRIISALVEGASMRSTSRMVGVSINTVTKLLVDVGTACARYQHDAMRNLRCERIQCDEIWCYCYAKAKNVPAELKGVPGYGDVWTFVAIDADTKLVPCWLVACGRDACYASIFLNDVAARLSNRVQLTSDGHKMYLEATESAFGGDVDSAQLVKVYGNPPATEPANPNTRYSPGECCGAERDVITGSPDHISTSFIERQNLTLRMRSRRFTRLTNAFSKKLDNLEHSVALHYMHYNFVRIHKSLRVTPAMKAKVTDHLWSLEEVVRLADKKISGLN